MLVWLSNCRTRKRWRHDVPAWIVTGDYPYVVLTWFQQTGTKKFSQPEGQYHHDYYYRRIRSQRNDFAEYEYVGSVVNDEAVPPSDGEASGPLDGRHSQWGEGQPCERSTD